MEKKILQIQEISLEDLTNVMRNSIREELNVLLIPQQTTEKLLSRAEVLELLQISEVTLWNWEKKGKIKGYGIGSKRYYKEAEILASLKTKQ